MSCNFNFSEFGELIAVKLYTDESNIRFNLPLQVYKPGVRVGGSNPELTFLTGTSVPVPIDLLIHLGDEPPLPKVETELSVSGYKSVVTFEFQFDRGRETEETYRSQVTAMRSGWYHALFEFSSGKQLIARATQDTWRFLNEETDGNSNGVITIENVSGLQILTNG